MQKVPRAILQEGVESDVSSSYGRPDVVEGGARDTGSTAPACNGADYGSDGAEKPAKSLMERQEEERQQKLHVQVLLTLRMAPMPWGSLCKTCVRFAFLVRALCEQVQGITSATRLSVHQITHSHTP